MGQMTAFQTVLVITPIKDMHPAAGTVKEDMAAMFLQARTAQTDNITAKTVDTFIKIGTTGIKIVGPERTAAEKPKTQGKK